MTQILEIGTGNETASKFMEPYLQSGNLNFLIGSGASAPAISVAGAIENELNELLAAGEDTQADIKCVEFIQAINAVHTKVVSGADANVNKVTNDYGELVSCIDRVLFARKSTLLPRQANLFTTNYDMFIEHASSLLPTVILNDGFERTASLSPNFMFAPERYLDRTFRSAPTYGHQIEIPTINLIKLHGSLSWRKKADAILYDSQPIKALSAADKADAAKVKAFLEHHFIILPNLKKFHTTLVERIYYDLLRLFSRAMDQQNVVLVCFGFSFADEHVLDITRRALRNPTSHLIIFSYDHASSVGYQTKFAKQRNVTVITPKTGVVIDMERLNKILSATLTGYRDAVA
jgi:hypothetical protein